MKNRFLAALLACLMAVSMAGCGSKEADTSEKTEKTETKKTKTSKQIEYDVDEYVTLGDYKGLEVTLDGDYAYSDEEFKSYVEESLKDAAIFIEDKDVTEVQEDSIVNVDYVGSQDDVPFDGGSAEDQMIDVAGNCAAGGNGGGYIDGFTSGLAGHKVGEEVAYEVTFPEQYGNADLAGQTVIFTFQINYVARAITTEADLTDEICADKLGYDTVDEYMAAKKEAFNAKLENDLKNDTQTAVLNAILEGSKVSEVPKKLLDARVDMYLQVYDKQYEAYGTTAKEYIESMGQDYDAYVENIRTSISESTETELILEAIAKKEGLEADDDGYKEFLSGVMGSSGASDEESFYEVYTVKGYEGERYFRQAYVTQKALDLCVDSATVNSNAPAKDSEDKESDSKDAE